MYKSEIKKEDLNPDWSEGEICLKHLCDGDFDAPIEFAIIHDSLTPRKSMQHRLMGSLKTTVNDMLVAAACGESKSMSKDGENTGQILVLQADYVGFTSTSVVLAAAAAAKEHVDASSIAAAAKSQVAESVQKEFEEAQQKADAKRKSEMAAREKLAEAQRAAELAMEEAQLSANLAGRMKDAGLMGTLKFQLVGKELKNVEAFTLVDKSDPFFVLQKAESEKGGRINW